MDYVTLILDAAKQRNGWTFGSVVGRSSYSGTALRNAYCECPLISAVKNQHPHSGLDNFDWDRAAEILNIPKAQILPIISSADHAQAGSFYENYNPFLRDRLCLELVGGYE